LFSLAKHLLFISQFAEPQLHVSVLMAEPVLSAQGGGEGLSIAFVVTRKEIKIITKIGKNIVGAAQGSC
jgi:hypothetical protein